MNTSKKLKKKMNSTTLKRFIKSIWFFPILLTLVLLVLSALQISGSSIGFYHQLFYGNDQKDPALLTGTPRAVRSDEILVNTQLALAQSHDLKQINTNIGSGENISLISDAPSNDWSVIFKPQNLGFLVLPFNNAFAFRWWFMGYILILGCYFFSVIYLKGKKIFSAILGLSLFFSPFVQWWYLSGTLGSLAYSFLILTSFIQLFKAKSTKFRIIWSVLLSYCLIAFGLIFYPPFQIPCVLVGLFFAIGFLLNNRIILKDKAFLKKWLLFLSASLLVALALIGTFLYQNKEVIATIQSTAYPGQRIIESGGYSKTHLLTGFVDYKLQDDKVANNYQAPSINGLNQSENSQFIYTSLFLLPILILLLYKDFCLKKSKKIDYVSVGFLAAGALLLAWLFIPGINPIGSLTLLNKVPLNRVVIGLGLLNILLIISFVKNYDKQTFVFNRKNSIIYSLLVFVFLLCFDFFIAVKFPQFLGYKATILLSLPLPFAIYFMLQKKYILAALIILLFGFFSTWQINPLYKGMDIISNNEISTDIQSVSKDSTKKWIADNIVFENFPALNNKPTLTGTYLYPQKELWEKAFPGEKNEFIYNRYAHVVFDFDRQDSAVIDTHLTPSSADQFFISSEPCSDFIKQSGVGFILTASPFPEGSAPCATLEKTVVYPRLSIFIYKLNF